MDAEPEENSISSPSTEEATAYPDFVSSYTQISNAQDLSQHTDVESSDEFSSSEDLKPKPSDEASIPQLSSQIIEWSKERFQAYDDEVDFDASPGKQSTPQKRTHQTEKMSKEKFYFVQTTLLQNIEKHANKLSQNVNIIMKFISDSSSNITSNSMQSIECLETSIYDTCESVDTNIKLMYKIIAICEELNRSVGFIETLAARIHEVKQTLELFERVIDKS